MKNYPKFVDQNPNPNFEKIKNNILFLTASIPFPERLMNGIEGKLYAVHNTVIYSWTSFLSSTVEMAVCVIFMRLSTVICCNAFAMRSVQECVIVWSTPAGLRQLVTIIHMTPPQCCTVHDVNSLCKSNARPQKQQKKKKRSFIIHAPAAAGPGSESNHFTLSKTYLHLRIKKKPPLLA